jgi:hypothetical protein
MQLYDLHVFALIVFIALAASVYEIDRREKSSTDAVTANLIPCGRTTPPARCAGLPSERRMLCRRDGC